MNKKITDLTNEELISYAQYGANKLNKSEIECLKAEITDRKLDLRLIEVIETISKDIDEDDLFYYSKFIQNLPCPICGIEGNTIDLIQIKNVFNLFILGHSDSVLKCGCKKCLRKKIRISNISTLLFGWWRFPSGPFRTIKALRYNCKRHKETKFHDVSIEYITFMTANYGYILTNYDRKSKLIDLLKSVNEL